MDIFRKEYKPLSDKQKDYIECFKQKAEALWFDFEEAALQKDFNHDPRAMALAKTNLEQAIMWAVKSITG